MRVVLDTNVFVSGVFFGGLPYRILEAWRRGVVKPVLSPEILDEYRRTGEQLASRFTDVDLAPWIGLLAIYCEVVHAPPLAEPVCTDSDDDKFLAHSLAHRAQMSPWRSRERSR